MAYFGRVGRKTTTESIDCYSHGLRCVCMSQVFTCTANDAALLMMLQYYEMSYGLNVEMHKQVSLFVCLLLRLFVTACLSSLKPLF